MGRMLAVLDADNVLVGRNDNPSDEEWAKAPAKLRFETGFDNAVKRYRLVEWKKGSWRFEAIAHGKDAGAENTETEVSIVAVLARMVAGVPRLTDHSRLAEYLKTFDAQAG